LAGRALQRDRNADRVPDHRQAVERGTRIARGASHRTRARALVPTNRAALTETGVSLPVRAIPDRHGASPGARGGGIASIRAALGALRSRTFERRQWGRESSMATKQDAVETIRLGIDR